MKITKNNLEEVKKINDKININYLESLYIDLIELNNELENKNLSHKKLYIDIQDYHDDYEEYSPERLDPCPDYYGYFTLRFENNPSEYIGDYIVDLSELDSILFALVEFIEY